MIKLDLRTAMALFTTGVLGLSAELAARGAALAREQNPDRNAYFGETHLHTSWSSDAWLFGNRVTGPADAYKYAGYEGASSAYSIKDGKVVTFLQDHPFEVTFYKLGDTIYGARSNEFGHANYEMLPKAVTENSGKENQAEFLHYDSEKK